MQHVYNSKFAGTLIFVVALVSATSFQLKRQDIEKDKQEFSAKQNVTKVESNSNVDDVKREIVDLKKTLDKDPLNGESLLRLANIMYDIGELQQAIELYRTFLEKVDPDNITAQIDYGYLVFKQENPNKGMEITSEVLKKSPNNQIALFNLGVMSYENKNIGEARAWFLKCNDVDSTSEIGRRASVALQKLKTEIQ